MPRLIYVTTHPIVFRNLLHGQLAYFHQRGYEVLAIATPGPDLDVVGPREGVQTIGVPMEREISPLKDFVSLVRLIRVFRQLRPDIVNASTSKAALLGMLAAWFTRVPVRVYLLLGLRLETTRGIKRLILGWAERLTAACAHRVVAVSHSLADMSVNLGLTSANKVKVLGNGSTNGVVVDRFVPTPKLCAQAADLRARWKLDAGTSVIGFVGRFVRDKGIGDLIEAFDIILQKIPETRLLLVGDFENGDPVPEVCARRIAADPRILRPGWVADAAPFYAVMNVLALPTYREGFPTVPLEAGAAEVPVVGYNATGVPDAVRNGITGTLVPVGDVAALAQALLAYLTDQTLRVRHGAAGREIALHDYRPEITWQGMEAQYRELLENVGRR